MAQFKYIRTKTGFTLWPDMTSVYHSHMAKLTSQQIISAGFCRYTGTVFVCYGEAKSLGIGSIPEDSAELTKFFDQTMYD